MSRSVPPSHPTRHSGRLALATCAALASLVLAACGSDGETEATTPAAAPSTDTPSVETATEAAAFPVTIDHKYGSTTVDADPQRVVSVGFTDQDFLLALGVTPVGIRDWYGDQPYGTWPWAQDELGGAQPELLPADALNFEQIAALRPDLIVGISSGMTQDDYDTLSKIAPTVAQPSEFVDYGTPWQDQTLLTGEALGKPAEAQALVDEVEAQFAQARDDNPEFTGATAAVAFLYNDQPGAYASQDGRSRVLTDLGFTIPAEYDELAGDSFFASFSGEQIALLDTDVLVWIGFDETTIKTLIDGPLRGGLKAAQEGREVFTDDELGAAFSFSSPLSLPYMLDELVPELASAVDGDPATVVPSAEAAGAIVPTDGGPTETSDESSAAMAAWASVFDSTAADADKIAHIEDAAALASVLAEYTAAGDGMGGITVKPTEATIDGDTATITYDVLFGGTSAGYPPQTGTMTSVDDNWVVSRADFCSFMTSARLSCPA